MLEICLAGCGGMMPLPERFLTSLAVRCGGHGLLIDCGEGTQVALRKSGVSMKPLDCILLTHLHADHVSGLPGLLLSMGNSDRTEPVRIVGPIGTREVVRALRTIAPGLPFEIVVEELGCAEQRFSCGELTVDAFGLDHGIPCYGYALTLPRAGKFDPERARAAGIPMSLWSRLQRGEICGGFRPEDVLGAPRKGLKCVYCTDSRPTEAITRHAAGADLLICEGMYGNPDRAEKAVAHKHMTFAEAARIARDAKVGALWLTHFSPAESEPSEFLYAAREIFPEAVIGIDGMRAALRFSD